LKKLKPEKNSKYRWLKIFSAVVITALALWLSFRKLDWQVLKETFLQPNFLWVILALANIILVVYALGWRWQILLKPKGKIPLGSLFRLNIISQYINIIIPGRFGEVSKAYLASKQYQISAPYVVGTIAIEKILDFFVFVIMWISVPALFAMQKEVKGYKIALFFCVVGAFFLVLFIWQPKTVLKGASFFSRFLPQKLRKTFQDFFEKGIEAFGLLRSTKILLFVVVLTFGFIAGQVLTNFLLFKAFHLNLSFWVGLFLLLAIQVANIPPSVPGKIGIFEYAVILALSLFGISKGLALSYGIMLHLVAYLPKILLGLIFLPGVDLSLRKNAKAQVEAKIMS
jgi:uncharacterized protein (TIRG00374 family)